MQTKVTWVLLAFCPIISIWSLPLAFGLIATVVVCSLIILKYRTASVEMQYVCDKGDRDVPLTLDEGDHIHLTTINYKFWFLRWHDTLWVSTSYKWND